jgi:hypothetical protein
LRKNIEFFPQKKLEKKPLVEKDIVENCCELKKHCRITKNDDEFKIES